jgi:hypothetical protein
MFLTDLHVVHEFDHAAVLAAASMRHMHEQGQIEGH